MKRLTLPFKKGEFEKLEAGENILLSGTVYALRDQAHKRLVEALEKRLRLPIDLRGAVIYYCAPTSAPSGRIIGSCGPTTSSRMDAFTPSLLKAGLAAMIGKGRRSKEVIEAIKKHKAVYFLAYAGCGALLSKFVKGYKVIAYADLGPEAVAMMEVQDMPLIVGVDTKGRSVYD